MSTGANETPQPLPIFVIDDDPDVRDALTLLLRLRGHSVEQFESAESFLDRVAPGTAGCVVTDIRMPGMSGLELQHAIAARGLGMPVIVLTAHGDIESARTALRAHAVDFLTKPFKESDLLAAIELALERESTRLVQQQQRAVDEAAIATLTTREREVAALLATGAQNVDVAQWLGISPRTVEIHKARCMEKLKVRTLADLVRLADRAGLQAPPRTDCSPSLRSDA
jgi:FixJ family two-component response regulator